MACSNCAFGTPRSMLPYTSSESFCVLAEMTVALMPSSVARRATSGMDVVFALRKMRRMRRCCWGVGHVDVRAAREHEVARRRGLGRGKDGRNKALFHDFAVVEDRNVIADLLHHAHLVCDDDDGDAKLFVDVADQLEDLARRLGVERARGLVAEQNFGVRGEGAGDGHALLLSAGELRGIGLGLILEPHDVEEFQSSLFAPLLLPAVRKAPSGSRRYRGSFAASAG